MSAVPLREYMLKWRRNTQHNDIQHTRDYLWHSAYTTLGINDTQHRITLQCWVLRFICFYAECHYAKCRYAEYRGAVNNNQNVLSLNTVMVGVILVMIIFSPPSIKLTKPRGQFVEQMLMHSSCFRCDQFTKVRDMILVTLCCAT